MVNAVERGQRAVIGKQVDGQRGAARLERLGDEAGRIDAVVPDYDHSHHQLTLRSAPARLLCIPLSDGAVTRLGQHAAEVDHHLGIDVLAHRRVEDRFSDPTVTVTLPS